MTEDEFLVGIAAEMVPATYNGKPDGEPVKGFAGLFFRALDVADMEVCSAYGKKHGAEQTWKMILCRAVRTADGTRVLSDEAADKLTDEGVNGNSLNFAIDVIRRISGQAVKPEKKVSSPDDNT